MGISIVIPFFNEKDRLPRTLSEIEVFMQLHPKMIDEVVIVDDGSTDNGVAVERAMRWMCRLPLKIVRLEYNSGKWAAVREGIKEAKGDWILLLDADYAARADELCFLGFDLKRSKGVAFFGSRFMKQSVVSGKSMLRTIVSKVYRVYVRLMYRYATGNVAPNDLQCPWKLFRKSELSLENMSVNRWAGDIDLALHLDVESIDVPIVFTHQVGSKVKSSAIFNMGFQTVVIAYRFRKGVIRGPEY